MSFCDPDRHDRHLRQLQQATFVFTASMVTGLGIGLVRRIVGGAFLDAFQLAAFVSAFWTLLFAIARTYREARGSLAPLALLEYLVASALIAGLMVLCIAALCAAWTPAWAVPLTVVVVALLLAALVSLSGVTMSDTAVQQQIGAGHEPGRPHRGRQ